MGRRFRCKGDGGCGSARLLGGEDFPGQLWVPILHIGFPGSVV
jgi:hypothetical protein